MSTAREDFFSTKIFGHPAGLFVLFFTEMWERFSFYGMRVLLINFLTMAAIGYNPGWEWSAENAGALFGTYAMLLYLTPIAGGIIADKLTGYNLAVVIGSIIMTLGHAAMALETELSLYLGLALLVIGTGFFKPNMTSIVSEMYKFLPEKKDGAYTIFYMGVNAGAFFGMMLCGYLAERVGWSWGFGLAGIFMFLGTLQFWLARPLFGGIGELPSGKHEAEIGEDITQAPKAELAAEEAELEQRNPFTLIDKVLIWITSIIALGYAINDPMSKIAGIDLFKAFAIDGVLEGQYVVVLFGLLLFLFLVISRIVRYPRVVRDRMLAFIIFAFFTVFFWMSFEQGATSLILFARDFVDRTLSGGAAVTYNIVNTLLTVIPLGIITYVLYLLFKGTRHRILSSNIVLAFTFLGVWAVVGWMLQRDWSTIAYDAEFLAYKTVSSKKDALQIDESTGELAISYSPVTVQDKKKVSDFEVQQRTLDIVKAPVTNKSTGSQEVKDGQPVFEYSLFDEENPPEGSHERISKVVTVAAVPMTNLLTGEQKMIDESQKLYSYYLLDNSGNFIKELQETTIGEADMKFAEGDKAKIITKENDFSAYAFLTKDKEDWAVDRGKTLNGDNGIVSATIKKVKKNWIEIPTSWFSILNSFFIIAFASFFSRWWDSKYNPSATVKYALGLIIMAVGFGFLAFGSQGVESGIKVSMVWLVIAYLFHTLGELCLSPVGLSYVSKLVPARMIAFMFGMWYLAIAIGNKVAAVLGGQIDNIREEYSLSGFFLIFTLVPAVAGLLILVLGPLLKRLMHGVK